jgi:uncharacterized protein YjbJ (UPF0337 family)
LTVTDTTDDSGGKTTSVKGEVKEVLGAVTGDRRVEASGRVEQQVADPETPVDEESDDLVSREEQAVRQVHGELPDGGDATDTTGPLGT